MTRLNLQLDVYLSLFRLTFMVLFPFAKITIRGNKRSIDGMEYEIKKTDFSIIISLYVVLSRGLSNFCNPSSYFSIIYGSFLVALKRLFDEQMVNTITYLKETPIFRLKMKIRFRMCEYQKNLVLVYLIPLHNFKHWQNRLL